MREYEIFAASVQIKTLSQFLHRHGRTFQVPSGSTRSNGGIPGSLARFGGLPKGKVSRAVLVIFVQVDTRSIAHFAEIFLREFPIARKAGDSKVIRPVFSAISHVLLDQPGNEGRHRRNMFGGPYQVR